MRLIRNFFLYILRGFLRFVISLRYRVHVHGLKEILNSKEQGILFLPNHTAEMDPLILVSILWSRFRPRPVVIEYFYYQTGLRFFMDLVKSIPLPIMETGNKWKERRMEKLKAMIVKKLEEGENFLIYPSGRLKLSSEEIIGGTSLVPDLLKLKSDAKVVLIRTTGLWGSTFSKAIDNDPKDFGKTLWHGFKVLLKNGIFFTPRRDVTVEMMFAPKDFPRKGDKIEINKWLEQWYNKQGPEEIQLVSFYFWKKVFPKVKPPKEEVVQEQVEIPKEEQQEILNYLSKMTNQPPESLDTHLHLSNDLGLDSIDVAQLNTFIEERFEMKRIASGQLQTVQDLFLAASGKKEQEVEPKYQKKKIQWSYESFRPPPKMPGGKTIQEVFLANCDKMKDAIACMDALANELSYKKFKRAALVLSLKIRTMPGKNIGILLPASIGAYLTIFATLLAGKVPVMLNWTSGFRNLEHAAELCSLSVILSSFRFLSRAENVDLGKTDDLLSLLEELRYQITFKEKLKGLFLSFRSAKGILKRLPKLPSEHDPAVILFTSGTETLPKGVPLSHANLLSNQRSALECVNMDEKDILFGILPPFHSFGFSVTGILPLLFGIKVCYAPDPTNSRSLSNDIERWKPTLFCSAPSFIRGVLSAAKEKQLESLRLVVSGAEKTPKDLYEAFQAKGKVLLEGYGISECSPIVTIEREKGSHEGVGKPIPGVELCVINPDSLELIDSQHEGEICISGPGVFNGYLDGNRNPFIELKGKRWYRSGDRGYIDQEGTLILTGRLKRFVKIGGEMVSLGGIEEELAKIYKEKGVIKEEEPSLAVTAKEKDTEKPQIIVFSTIDLNRDEINQQLKELGHGSLVKISEIRKIDTIPVTGTGKIHYRILDEQL